MENPTTHTDFEIWLQTERLRVLLANKRDKLVARQRRKFSKTRMLIIDNLGNQYRELVTLSSQTNPCT